MEAREKFLLWRGKQHGKHRSVLGKGGQKIQYCIRGQQCSGKKKTSLKITSGVEKKGQAKRIGKEKRALYWEFSLWNLIRKKKNTGGEKEAKRGE